MKRPKFTREQLSWIRWAIIPSCCHVSGEHNPTHFEESPSKVCYLQKYKAYEVFLKRVNMKQMRGKSLVGFCYRCDKKAKPTEEGR